MALTWRQLRVYRHRMTVYREVESIGALGQPGNSTGSTVMTDTPCRFQTGPSQFEPQGGVVLDESDNIMVLDHIHMEQGLDVKIGDVLLQTTGPEVGRHWRVRGSPQVREIHANKQSVLAARLEAPPGWVP